MEKPTRFQVKGLFGSRDVDLPLGSDALILVGPNGIGKSCVTNIFYFFISRQWARLGEYDFTEVALWFGEEEIRALRADILGLSQLDKVFRDINPHSRVAILLDRLRSVGLIEEMVSPRLTSKKRNEIAAYLGVAPDEMRQLQFSIRRRLSNLGDEELFASPRGDVDKKLAAKMPGRTLYLPTYRRIEKDLRDIFPDLDERVRATGSSSSPFKVARSASHYVDLVSFGMEDVKSNIDSKTRFLRDYSLAQFNDLSGLYLRDVIRGTADQYSPSQISDLDENALAVILGRVSEQVLSAEEKNLLRTKILDMQGKRRLDLEVNDLYLAHYFSRLMSASADISLQEKEIIAFVDVCNAYLRPGKELVYDDTKFTVEIIDEAGRPLELSMLSSGEKQVVSLFSHLYLDDAEGQIVIIDEPELSLSVPWQKRFLTDILKSPRCSFIFSVTHSPFIYQNELKGSAIDLRLKTSASVGGE
ncbi:AAA family ATPase [Pseudomonas sp. A2]|uniref:AAA family ATPase n=1 Tax=Pseudomonas sp. A2 TaxID=107445 RepID=UPI001FFF52F6|nr:AAA family ATPase [Pseudomonas sp. A2]UPK87453.1 ATP-binding protein [Pseudomonas sp. A2]